MKPISTGLTSFGMTSRVMHAPFLGSMPEFEISCILERHRDDSLALYPKAGIVRDLDELLSFPDLELVVVTSPNETHFEYAKKALEAGMHVVLEKPFTIHSSQALELIRISQITGRCLSVFQNRRYACDFLTIRKILDDQLLGKIVEFEAHYDRYRPELKPNAWREKDLPGSGILYDLGSHLIDQALLLFGLPQSITADIRIQRPNGIVNDYFDLRLDYGYSKAILKSGMLVREPGPRYMVHGLKGSFIKSGEDPQEELLKIGKIPDQPDWGKEAEENWGLLHTEINGKIFRAKYPSFNGNFGLFYKNLFLSIRAGVPLREKAEQGYNTIRMVELAMDSHEKKSTITCSGLLSLNN